MKTDILFGLARSLLLCWFLSIPLISISQKAGISPENRFFLSLSMDVPFQGFGTSLESAMKKSGFGDSSQCFWFCTGTKQHPHSSVAPVFNVNLEYRINRNIQVGSLIGWAEKGETFGYDKQLNYGAGYFFIKYSVVQLSPHIRLHTNDRRFYIQAGTGLFFISTKRSSSHHSGNKNPRLETKFAGNLGAGIYLFEKPRAFMTVNFQYNLVFGMVQIGPYNDPFNDHQGPSEIVFDKQHGNVTIYQIGLSYGRKF